MINSFNNNISYKFIYYIYFILIIYIFKSIDLDIL